MQVFSDSFRDTNVKMDPGMESQVSEAPWGTQEIQELRALQSRPTSSSPPLKHPRRTYPTLGALVSMASQRKQDQSFLD